MKQITSIILTALMAFAFVGCTDEPLIDNIYSTLELDESDIIETQLTVSVTDFSITATATRADSDPDNEKPSGDTETMSDFEKTIDNIWVFQYDTIGDILITPRYYTAEKSYSDGTWDVELNPVRSTIYVVTNVNDALWVTTSTLNNFATINALLSETISTPRFISDMSDTSDEGHIPMQGCVEGVTPSDNGSDIIVVPVEHMYAKVKMRFVIDDLLAQYDAVKVTNVSFSNIPYYCRVQTLYDATRASMDIFYPSDCWNSRYINTANNTDDPNNEGLDNTYDYVIYVPENIQGESSNTDEDQKKAPDDNIKHPSLITAYISYIDDDGAQRAASYTMYPGGNNYNNYNIRRNQVYRVTMNIAYPEEIIRQPSANCLFGFAGETIAFYPYYRVETGGYNDGDNSYTNNYQNEYHFENYLYPTPGDGSGYEGQKIGGLKIIWQTEGCIGNNSKGDLVYLVSTAAEGTHDGYEQIYVKTAGEGNALIAAYADEACEGDILWSWHIWVRAPGQTDPTDLANAYSYYTYDWDLQRIYSYKYYTDCNETPVRIPGYQIMSCNIGALQDEPNYDKNKFFGHHYNDAAPSSGETDLRRIQYFEEGDGIVRTFGMMYQWGRKDPFPPLTTTIGGTGDQSAYNTGYYIQNYDDEHTQKLYGNDGKEEVHKTSYETETYLFHSHIAGSGEGMAYTIKHPTVFMCGTKASAQTLTDAATSLDKTDYVKSLSNYVYKGGWSEEDEYDNNEWGGLDISKSNKSLNLGFQDQEGFDIYLYEDYGTKKTIFDPCPYGWRVSSGDLWLGFTQNGVNAYEDYTVQNQYKDGVNTAGNDTDGKVDYINYDPDKSCLLGMTLYLGSSWRSGHTTWFPTQGFLMPDGCGYRVGGCGNYVNANANSDYSTSYDRVYITHIHDRISTFRVFEHQLHYTVKSAANPLRCVRDTK